MSQRPTTFLSALAVLATAGVAFAAPRSAAARSRTRTEPPVVAAATSKKAPRVAVTSLSLFLEKKISPDTRSIYRIVEQGLVQGGLAVITEARVRQGLAAHAGLHGCETPVCLNQIGRLLGAPFCAQVKAWKGEGSKLQIAVVITWSHSGLVAVRQTHDCDRCTTTKFRAALSRISVKAGQRALAMYRANPPPRLRPRTTNGANGRNVAARRLRARRLRARRLRISGIALVAAGAASLVSGGILLGLHGKTTTRGCDPLYLRCKRETRAPGIVATALGSAALLTGVALLIYHYLVDGRRPKVVVGVDPAQRTLMVKGRF